jgi:integrase/recombinase XerC
MVQRRTMFTLSDPGGQVVHVGDLAATNAFLAARPRTDRRYKTPPPGSWAPMIDDYLRHIAAAGQRPATIELRRDHLNRIARGLACPPETVTAELLVDWFGQQTHWSLETRRSYRSAARGFFTWAHTTGRTALDPANTLPRVRQIMPAPKPTPDKIWREALMAADARTRLMLRLAAEAGLRRAEIAQVHTRDVLDSVDGAQLLVHGKGGKQRVVPISDSLADALRLGAVVPISDSLADALRLGASSTGWLFPTPRGGHVTAGWVGELVKAALPGGWTTHSLRHRFATRAYRGTRNLRAVQVLLGHASIVTTERYTAVNDSEIRAAMNAAVAD